MGAEMVRERKVNLGVTSASFGSLLGQRILALTDIFDNLGGGLVPFGNPFGKHSFDDPNTAWGGFRRQFFKRHVF